MKSTGLLAKAAMVRAYLDGRKTQTRRLVNRKFNGPVAGPDFDGFWSETKDPVTRYFICPNGQPGDEVWIRETFADISGPEKRALYRADNTDATRVIDDLKGWTPSIHMPRWACRLAMPITAVRCERLQAITEEDARAEGCGQLLQEVNAATGQAYGSYRASFKVLWNRLYGPDAWDLNPYVWVIETPKQGGPTPDPRGGLYTPSTLLPP